MTIAVDREKVVKLANKLTDCICEHYKSNDPAPERVLEVLNAIACAAAMVLVGTGPDLAICDFFETAIAAQISSNLSAMYVHDTPEGKQ